VEDQHYVCIVNRNRNAKSVEELHCAFITGKKFDVKNVEDLEYVGIIS
jgi:hypothetical protein